LCWLYTCLHLDRQIPGVLAEATKSSLGLEDQQLGALSGSAFSIVYALLGLYFGGVADRSDRLLLVRAGALIWSLACIAAAFAPGYVSLIACRGGVAVGEAVATAAAISLMAEIALERYRARTTSVFFAFAFVGAGTAAIAGGFVLGLWQHSTLAGWRAAMVMAGLPGIAGAIYLTLLRYRSAPPRGSEAPPSGMPTTLIAAALAAILIQISLPALWGVPASVLFALAVALYWVRRLRRHDPEAYAGTLGQQSFRWLLGSFTAVLFVDFAAAFWFIPYMQRRFGVSAASAGEQLGSLIIVGGIVGTLCGGWCADRWHRATPAGRVWTALVAVLLEGVALLCALLQESSYSFLVAFAVFCFASGGWTGVAAAIGLDIVPRAHRGVGTAAYFLITTVLGAGLGPFIVGLCSDLVGSVGTAIAWCSPVMLVAVAALARLGWLVSRNSRQLTVSA
jgi:MFS family permease